MRTTALVAAVAVSLFACKKGESDQPAEKEPQASRAVPVKIAKDAAPPKSLPPLDAAPVPTGVVEDPLQYAERGPAKHRKHLAKCPRGKGPCIAGFDFAFFVYDASWKHYYAIDPGRPDSPVRAGNADFRLVNHRMSAAAAAAIKKEGKKGGLLRCDSAYRFYQIAKLDPYVTVDVSSQGAALADGTDALKKVSAKGANEAMVKFYQQLDPDPMGKQRRPQFSDRELASMTNTAFDKPRVVRGYSWIGRENELSYGRFTIVYSPTSSTVYIDTRVDKGNADDVLDEKNLAKFEDEDLARVRGLISQLGLEEVELAVGSLCELGQLGGYSEWIPFEI